MEAEKQEDQSKSDASAPEQAPPMNRAERRALEHHKKSGSKPGAMGAMNGRGGGAAMREGGHSNTHLPRTGHK